MNNVTAQSIIEKAKAKSKKDWTGAKADKDRFILPEKADIDPALEDELMSQRQGKSGKDWREKKKEVSEARGSDYTLYHKSYTDAINHALSHHEKSGLHVSDDDRFQHVGVGSKKPSEGNTTSVNIPATHTSGKKHMIHVQVFNKGGTHPYELNTYSSGMGRHVKEEAEIEEAYGMWKVEFPKQHAGKAVAAGSVHVKAQNTAHAHKVAAKRVGVDHKVFKSKVTKSSILPEELEELMERGEDSKGHYRATEDGAGLTRKGAKAMGVKTAVTTPPSKLDPNGKAAKRRKSFCARMGGMKGPMKDEKGRPTRKAMSLRRWNCRTEETQLDEVLGTDNEWGRPELRKKFAAITPGQEGLTADEIPTMNPFSGDAIHEEDLHEISALGAKKRSQFAAKLRKKLADPKSIAKAKKEIAKKKAAEKDEAPKHLVMQLRKASSIGSKVKFYDGSEHHVAPNHVEKFNDRYHSLKSSIEKESLVKRAHKSHADFMRAISEETEMGQPEAPCTCNISPANYPTSNQLSPDPMLGDMNNDAEVNEWDEAAIEADATHEIENSSWQDLSKYYEGEEDEDEEEEEELEEAITPQGRLKKKFAAMRNKTRRNLAKNMALKRIATPDVIKGRSIRAARRMVYKRILRNRDPSTVSAAEKARIEAQVKRMAPMVSRLSIRLQQAERKRDQARVVNARSRKK